MRNGLFCSGRVEHVSSKEATQLCELRSDNNLLVPFEITLS
jgi:hypothetical protein